MFEFEWSWIFSLFLLPILFRKWVKPVDKVSSQALIIPFLDELSSQTRSRHTLPDLKHALIVMIAWCFLIAAAAKPVWIDNTTNQTISHRNIMIAVDLSGSMAQKDFSQGNRPVTRLQAAKTVAADFVSRRVGDKIGLILFADHAYLQAPLTSDRKTVMQFLNEAEIGLAGKRTALGNAIGLAVKKVQQQADQEHVLVLMTDGAATVGVNIDEAIRFANKEKLKIYTLGIGSSSLDTTRFSRNSSHHKSSDLDEKTLKKIASKTGGHYFKASNVKDLQSIYKEIDKLEPIIENSNSWHHRKDLFHIPLSLFSLTMIILGLLQLMRRRMNHD